MKEIWRQYRKDIIFSVIIVILFIITCFAIRGCVENSRRNDNNILALTDSIHTYNDKLDELVAYKVLMEGDLKELRVANESLYNKVKAMKIPGSTNTVVYMKGSTELPTHDTTWVVSTDTMKNFTKEFSFNDKWHSLEGEVSYLHDSLDLKISRNEVNFDYTIGVNNKNQVYISSSNPYVRYDEITGLTLPKNKVKKFGIGPYIGYGYDIKNKEWDTSIGISVTYNLIRF